MEGTEQETEVKAELVTTQPRAIVHPIGSSLAELAGAEDRGVSIMKARHQILSTARKAAISLTKPGDWLLFKQPEPPKGNGQINAYLQDGGADRVRDIFGIEVFNVKMERISSTTGYIYVCSGDGRSNLTGQIVEAVEGGRSSTDDFITRRKEKEGDKWDDASMELTVRKMARANLDGRITRSLAGLEQVPASELEAAGINLNHCTRGRGFGDSRGGEIPRQSTAPSQHSAPSTGKKPTCATCGAEMQFRKAGVSTGGKEYPAFWSCPSKDHKYTLHDSDWKKVLAAEPKQATDEEPPMTDKDVPF